jgi:D-apionolactonase
MTVPAQNSLLRDLVRRDGVGPIWCDGQEILRRIFVTVRDKDWQEVPPIHWESHLDEGQRIAKLSANHTGDSVAFEWRGTLQVSDDLRHIRFWIDGRVLRDTEVCRLGLVVLHPVTSMVGADLLVGPNAEHHLTVEETIAPQLIVGGIPTAMTEPFSKLVVHRNDFGSLEFQFEGDLFEIEDQRNWGDASFKTYCTPLRLGFPRIVKAGTSIVQSVEIRFTSNAECSATSPRILVPGGRRSLPSTSGAFPKMGREWKLESDADPQLIGDKRVTWHHLHVNVNGNQSVSSLRTLLDSGTPSNIEIAIDAKDDEPSPELLGLVARHREKISRLILYGPTASLPAPDSVEPWRRRLESLTLPSNIALLAGTRGYFVEFNRGADSRAAVSGTAFPLTATVHSDDAETIADNVAAIREMAHSARVRSGCNEVAVTPLALYYPAHPRSQHFPREMVVPWLAATLIHTSLAGIASVTLASDVIEAVSQSGLGAKQLILRLVACAGFQVTFLQQESSYLHAAVFTSPASDRWLALAANLGSQNALFSLNQNAFTAKTLTNAVTGESGEIEGDHLDLPKLSVFWIES